MDKMDWAAIITATLAMIGAVMSYSTTMAKVSFLEREIREMKSKSSERQTRIYDMFNEIKEDITEMKVNLAKLNGE